MYGFNFWTVKILKNVIVLFSKCWPPTVVSHALFLCYSLLNMFVTVAVINVKLLAVWGYVAFLHVSVLCAVSYTLYGHEYEWDWDQVSGLNHHSCCAHVCVCVCVCVSMNDRIMCVWVCVCVHVTACHNLGKAAYYTEGLYKNVLSAFGILLTVC